MWPNENISHLIEHSRLMSREYLPIYPLLNILQNTLFKNHTYQYQYLTTTSFLSLNLLSSKKLKYWKYLPIYAQPKYSTTSFFSLNHHK